MKEVKFLTPVRSKLFLPQAKLEDFPIQMDFRDLHGSLSRLHKISETVYKGGESTMFQRVLSVMEKGYASFVKDETRTLYVDAL